MFPMSRTGPLLRRLLVVVISCAAIVTCSAQEQEGDRVYRFTVLSVSDPVAAKPVQHAMMDQGFVHACAFVNECACFKMAVPTALTYDQLKDMLVISGFTLTGPVHVSDGSVLIPASPNSPGK